MIRFLLIQYLRLRESILEGNVSAGATLIEEGKVALKRNKEKLAQKQAELRSVRARLNLLEKPEALISDATRRA